MPCDDNVLNAMIAAIDGDAAHELTEHLADCAGCRDEWQRVAEIDRLLRSAPPAEPPADLVARVEQHMARSLDRTTAWRITLANIGIVTAGTALIAFAAATVALRVDLSDIADLVWRMPALDEVMALAVRAARGPLGVLALGALAASLAIAWFAVLFLPRTTPRVDGP